MKILSRIFCVVLILLGFTLGSCVKTNDLNFEEVEKIALKSWIEKNRPELLDNYQPQGGYQQPAQPSFQQPGVQQPGVQPQSYAPVQQPAPQQAAGEDMPEDDLPF